jgi:hypothetical protein
MSGTVTRTDGQARVAAIYARVSSERQRQEQTIASQTAALRELAEQRGLLVPKEFVFEDDGFSGASLQRPALERLRDRAFEGCFEVVLCHAPDRLARRYAYQVLLVEELARGGIEVAFAKEPERSGSPEDELLFGIRFGYERVVLYLEPRVDEDRLEANTARTLLLLDHEPLPWARWAQEFAAVMPRELGELQERAASADGVSHREAIRARLAAHLPLYRLSRYRPPRPPTARSRSAPRTPAGAPEQYGTDAGRLASRTDDDASMLALVDGAEVDLPDVVWVSVADGTRAPGDLEDQAARYDAVRHELTINADFRAITDMIAHWTRRYRGTPGAGPVIRAQVREWFEQTLVEVVLCVRGSHWNEEQLAALLCPSALSAAVLPRHLLHAVLNKRLGQKLGSARA